MQTTIKRTPTTAQEDTIKPLSAEEQAAVEQYVKTLGKMLESEGQKALYRLEVFFHSVRSTWKPTFGIVSFWAAGARLSGEGDAKLYLCPGERLGKSNCEAIIPEAGMSDGKIFCPTCNMVWTQEQVIGEIMYRLTMQNWAHVLLRHYRTLGSNADITLKFSPDELRKATTSEQEKFKGGELMDSVRIKRIRQGAVYPLRNIIKDTTAGADMYSRVLAFLTA